MPLFENRPFVKNVLTDVKDEEEIFYCEPTGEPFRSYEEYFERTCVLNTKLWSCELCGVAKQSYSESMQCEANCKKIKETFPAALRKPLLHVASLTSRTNFKTVCHDVFRYVEKRFFVEEELELGDRKCRVLKVVPPEAVSEDETDESLLEKYKYEVELLDEEDDVKMVTAKDVVRNKIEFSQTKLKTFLRQHMENLKGIWIIRTKIEEEFQLKNCQEEDILNGPPPRFENLKVSQNKALKPKPDQNAEGKENKKVLTPEEEAANEEKRISDELKKKQRQEQMKERERKRGELKREKEEKEKEREREKEEREKEKERKKEEGIKEREKKREERRQLKQQQIEWGKPRDDLECEDHQDLPRPTRINGEIPQEIFRDFILLLEFFHCYSDALSLQDKFPDGLSFELLKRALTETAVKGPLFDLLHLILTMLLEARFQAPTENMKERELALKIQEFFTASEVPELYFGFPICKMVPDPFKISEFLRIHILMSTKTDNSKFDPSSIFRDMHGDILDRLSTISVFELSAEEKLKILNLLMEQLLRLEPVKQAKEQSPEKIRNLEEGFKTQQALYRDAVRKSTKLMDDQKSEEKSESSENPLDESTSESLRMVEEHLQKKHDIMRNILKLQNMNAVQPLGLDRTFRRFYVFSSLPGLFVDDHNVLAGRCAARKEPESGLCTHSASTCRVHNESLSSSEWGFYHEASEITGLHASLNSRGFRESALKKQLEKDFMLEAIKECPVDFLTTNADEQPDQPANEISAEFCAAACKTMLKLEERIFSGSLGTVKVENRDEWKQNLQELNQTLEKEDMPIQKLVKTLSTALHQIAKGVEKRFFKPPLGYGQRKSKQPQPSENYDENADVDADRNVEIKEKSPFVQWSKSLVSCTNLSQVFLHKFTLDNSILWEKAVAKVTCSICGNKEKPRYMVECGKCQEKFHPECVKPKIKDYENWNCKNCREPKQRKRKREVTDEESEEENPPSKKARKEYLISNKKRRSLKDEKINIDVCKTILKHLWRHEDSGIFRKPVTVKDAPDYFDFIQNPMDLSTLKRNLRSGDYESNEDFMTDVWLIFDNCAAYNQKGTEVYIAGENMRKRAIELYEDLFGDEVQPRKKRKSRKD